MVDSKRLETYVGSLTRCLGMPAFLDRFYEVFLESSPEVAEKFKHTNFARQKVALGQSLYLMVMAAEGVRYHAPYATVVAGALFVAWLESVRAFAAGLERAHDRLGTRTCLARPGHPPWPKQPRACLHRAPRRLAYPADAVGLP